MQPKDIHSGLNPLVGLLACWLVLAGYLPTSAAESQPSLLESPFQWRTESPVLEATPVDGEDWHSVKDPSVVWHKDRWHLFCTVRGKARTHGIAYLAFRDWPEAKRGKRSILRCHPGYFCAPQVFYFTPHKKWYLVCQASDEAWRPNYQPAFSQTTDLENPDSWSPLQPLFPSEDPGVKAWLDFWVICDDAKAHLFYTSLDGKMWRMETPITQFPHGWGKPQLALEGDIFEASHTYRVQGRSNYFTLIEAQNGHGWRYFKAYLADRLEGPWRPLAAGKDNAFASMKNVRQTEQRWTDVVSHGEILRVGTDERLIIDPTNMKMIIQGVLDKDRQGKSYGDIPWKLGVLGLDGTPARSLSTDP